MLRSRLVHTLALAAVIVGLGRTANAQSDQLPDRALIMQWASLTAYLIDEFRVDQRDAIANIEGDFSSLEVKVRVTSNREDVWVTRTFTESELRSADVRAIAKSIYLSARRKIDR